MKIVHIADLHIQRDRISEYKAVFDALIVDLTKIKPDLVVIAGDIFTQKDHVKPEEYDLFNWLVNTIAGTESKCLGIHLIVIAGNHDCNMNNGNRMDLITPLYNHKKTDKFHFYSKSGIYTITDFPDINFIIYGTLDSELPELKDGDAKFNVCIAHVTIDGSTVYSGAVLRNTKAPLDHFKKYDIVLLGDIHKMQYLTPHIAYPGSILQQDIGEHPLDHGYILWNIDPKNKSKTSSKFVRLKNPKGVFLKVEVVDGKLITNIDGIVKTRGKIKVIHNGDIGDVIKELRSKYRSPIELTDKRRYTPIETKEPTHNLSDIQRLTKWLDTNRVHLKAKVLALHEETSKEIQSTHGNGHVFKIKSLEWCNMFGYSGDKVYNIDFNDLYQHGDFVGISGKNKSGKSSIVEIIFYLLWNQLSYGDMNKEFIINQGSANFYCAIVLEADCHEYIIVRWGVRSKTSQGHKVYKDKVDITGSTLPNTYQYLAKHVVGSKEDFLNLVYHGTETSRFINAKTDEQTNYICAFLGLERYNKLLKLTKTKLLSKEKLKTSIKTDSLSSLTEQRDHLRQEQIKLQESLSIISVEKGRTTEQIKQIPTDHSIEYIGVPEDLIDGIVIYGTEVKTDITLTEQEKTMTYSEIQAMLDKYKLVRNLDYKLSVAEYSEYKNKIPKIKGTVVELRKQLQLFGNTDLESVKVELQQLRNHYDNRYSLVSEAIVDRQVDLEGAMYSPTGHAKLFRQISELESLVTEFYKKTAGLTEPKIQKCEVVHGLTKKPIHYQPWFLDRISIIAKPSVSEPSVDDIQSVEFELKHLSNNVTLDNGSTMAEIREKLKEMLSVDPTYHVGKIITPVGPAKEWYCSNVAKPQAPNGPRVTQSDIVKLQKIPPVLKPTVERPTALIGVHIDHLAKFNWSQECKECGSNSKLLTSDSDLLDLWNKYDMYLNKVELLNSLTSLDREWEKYDSDLENYNYNEQLKEYKLCSLSKLKASLELTLKYLELRDLKSDLHKRKQQWDRYNKYILNKEYLDALENNAHVDAQLWYSIDDPRPTLTAIRESLSRMTAIGASQAKSVHKQILDLEKIIDLHESLHILESENVLNKARLLQVHKERCLMHKANVLQKKKWQCGKDLDTVSKKLRTIESDLDKVIESMSDAKKRDSLDSEIAVLKQYLTALDPNTGFVAESVDHAKNLFITQVNSYLDLMDSDRVIIGPKGLQLISNEQSGRHALPLNMGSGYQKTALSLAIRTALQMWHQDNKIPQLLIVDENIMSTLDDNHRKKLVTDMIPNLCKVLQVIIITHDHALLNNADNILYIPNGLNTGSTFNNYFGKSITTITGKS